LEDCLLRAEQNDEIEEATWQEIQRVLDDADTALHFSAVQLDALDTREKLSKIESQQRPKIKFNVFTGAPQEWPTFLVNKEKIYKLYEHDKNQQLVQLAEICTEPIAASILRFSGTDNGPRRAFEALQLKFGIVHLQLPEILAKLRNIKAARNTREIPKVAEEILADLESISAMGEADTGTLPQEIIYSIINALRFDAGEKMKLVPLLKDPSGVSLTVLREMTRDRFENFELINRTLDKHRSFDKSQKNPGQDPLPHVSGGAAQTEEDSKRRTRRKNQGTKPGEGPKVPSDQVSGPGKLQNPGARKVPTCTFCRLKNKAPEVSKHTIFKCDHVNPTARLQLVQLGLCVACLRNKGVGAEAAAHKCTKDSFYTGHPKNVYCTACKTNVKLCANPTAHTVGPLPDILSGFSQIMGQTAEENSDQGGATTLATILSSVQQQAQKIFRILGVGARVHPGHQARQVQEDHQDQTLPANRGRLGKTAPIVTWLTMVKDGDKVRCQVLVDGGSESSYFSPDLQPMAITTRKQAFRLETLSTTAASKEKVEGLECGFNIEVGSGENLRINLLKHDGLGARDVHLRPKVITCAGWFAEKHKLNQAGLTSHCLEEGHEEQHVRSSAKLSIVLGLDLMHIAPKLVDTFTDQHGFMSVYYCSLMPGIVASGNRTFPLSVAAVDKLLARKKPSATSGCFTQTCGEMQEDWVPVTSLLAAATSLPPLDLGLPHAHVVNPGPALQFLHNGQPAGETDMHDTETEDSEEEGDATDDEVAAQVRVEEARRLLTTGVVSQSLHRRLEMFTHPQPQPRHQLSVDCVTCGNCPKCIEDVSGQNYYMRLQVELFKKHLRKVPSDDERGLTKYRYQVQYIGDPSASSLPTNYSHCHMRHIALRRAFQKLPQEVQMEFSRRLTDGVAQNFWEIVKPEENAVMQRGGCHWLPANFMLKEAGSHASTKCRLVLDPSQSLNGTLLDPPNLERGISLVLRRLQALPIMFSCDIKECFFKLKLHRDSQDQLLFLMDYDRSTGQLTAAVGPDTELVTIRPLVTVMGAKQSPAMLSLAKIDLAEGIKEKDRTLSEHLKELAYVDDCQSGLHAYEVAACQQDTGSNDMINPSPCQDIECCPGGEVTCNSGPANGNGADQASIAMVPAVPQDELRASRHLLQGVFGQKLTHQLLVRAATLELALRNAGMPTKGHSSNLSQVVCPRFLNEAVMTYTHILSRNQQPTLTTLLNIEPPPGFVICSRQRWYRPWKPAGLALPSGAPPSPSRHEPILRLAAPPTANVGDGGGDTLLGYKWNPELDYISTDKSVFLNIHPARRGVRPAWARIHEAKDILRIHQIKPLRQKHALSAAHSCFDPLHSAPWVQAMLKYMYRFLILSSPGAAHYEMELTEQFVKQHLYYAIEGILKAKKLLAQRRTWRLPLAVDYTSVTIEFDCLADGCWGVLAGSGTICYLLQRYQWKDEKRTSIYLYSASVGLNPLSKVTHQVDAELQGLALAVSETRKAKVGLADEGVQIQPRLTSDSQTALSLCCKAAVQLDLGAGLTISRVQEMFGYDNLHYAPGHLFESNVDLLTRYDVNLLSKVTEDFYSPEFLKPEIQNRLTTPVKDMVKVDHLPHLCPKQMIWCKVAESLPANLLQLSVDPGTGPAGYSSTGRSALHRRETCVQPCMVCGTSKPEDAHMQDKVLLQTAQDKFKTRLKAKSEVSKTKVTMTRPAGRRTLAAASLGAFKSHRPRHVARSARSGLLDKRPITDDNPWSQLLSRRRGYRPAQRVLARILTLFRKWKAKDENDLPEMDQALKLLFSGERANSYKAAETRRGNQTWSLVEESNILFIQGRAYDPGPSDSPSILMQEDHLIIGDKQQKSYMVPLLSPNSALGKAVCQQVHDQFCGESAASALARSSRYFYHTPSALRYFQYLSDSCYKCRRMRAKRGYDVIAPMRNIGEDSMVEGNSVMVDVAGPWNLFVNPRQVGSVTTRAAKRSPRNKVKVWLLLGVDIFSHRVEVALLDSMTTDSLTSGLAEIMSATGWRTRHIALDPGSSLLPAAHRTARLIQEDDEEPAEAEDDGEGLQPEAAAELLEGLRQSGFKVRTPFTKASWKQAKIESSIRIFKRTLTASLMPGTSTPLTVVSFGRAARMSCALMNMRPIVLIPSTGADPDELTSCSPASLRGPAHSEWAALGAGRDFSGQAAIIQQQQRKFRACWIKFYLRRMRATHKMAQDGPGWEEDDICLITDLPSRSGRDHPHSRLARITGWMDQQRSQAILKYDGGTVNRPVGKLILLVKKGEVIPPKGLLFDHLVANDREVFQHEADTRGLPADEAMKRPDTVAPQEPTAAEATERPAAVETADPAIVGPATVETAEPLATEPRRSARHRRQPDRFEMEGR
jgi:hypothetical protein